VVVLLVIAAMQVAMVRFVDPPRTMPMCRVKGFASTRLRVRVASSGAKAPLRYRWIPLAQIPPRKSLQLTRLRVWGA
jgi:hypothetical protein